MPFTVSHAAAVLPFRRSRLPWSALVIGSFGPDFEYFLRMNYGSRGWHQYPQVLSCCLPFCVLAYFLFHLCIEQPVVELLPRALESRIGVRASWWPKGVAEFFWIVAAVSVGIATHLFWDAWTHSYTWPWEHLPFLRKDFHFHGFPYRHLYGFEITQSVSTVSGLVILGIWLARWYRRTPPELTRPRRWSAGTKLSIWLVVGVVSVAGALWRIHEMLGPLNRLFTSSVYHLMFVIGTIAWFGISLFVYGAFTTLRRGSVKSE